MKCKRQLFLQRSMLDPRRPVLFYSHLVRNTLEMLPDARLLATQRTGAETVSRCLKIALLSPRP